MRVMSVFGLFIATAVAEIAGCYLPYLWLRNKYRVKRRFMVGPRCGERYGVKTVSADSTAVMTRDELLTA